ncbi:hypothetical protein CJU90_4466 [Yarrowia sp. C11]|nr:hypothetical protein CKK34_6746 [Yarrowia sp. E02]KAG5365388.1 hypothetical protein CJU90_4466 [Yarrowia sp. C11]
MLFKIISVLTLASAAFSAPCVCETKTDKPAPAPTNKPAPAPVHPRYTLHVITSGKPQDMQALQVRGNDIVYGLTQGFYYFKAEDVGAAMANIVADGIDTRQLFANVQTGKLEVLDHPAPPVGIKGNTGGWAFKGDGSMKEVSSYGTNQFYSCNSKTDPLHGGQVVYVFNGGYQCKDPIKFSIGATV